jgi:hypothetical protein
MGKSAGGNVSTSTSSYPTWQQPAVKQFVDESTRLYQQGGPKLSPEPRVADFNQDELAAQKQLGAAVTPAQYLAELGTKSAEFNLGAGRDPATNPYLKNAISAAVAPIGDQLLTRALPAIRHQGIASGGYGGSRQSIGEAQAVRDAERVAGEVSSGLANQGYLSAQQQAMQTMQQLPQLQSNLTAPGQITGAVGALIRAQEEAQRNENADRYEYYQRLPYQNLLNYGNMISQPFGAEAQSEVKVPQPSTASAIIGAGLSVPALLAIIEAMRKGGTVPAGQGTIPPGTTAPTTVGTPPGGTSGFFG